MRKRDKQADLHPTKIHTKAAKTINFDKIVLKKIEECAERAGMKESTFVNQVMKGVVMSDYEFLGEMAAYHYLEYQRYKYLQKEAPTILRVLP